MDEPRPGTVGSGPDSGQAPRRTPRSAPASPGGPAEMGQALDVLRVAASIAVVLYHASLAYLVQPLRLTLWFYDARPHVAMDVLACWVNGFAMPLFFLAAGISAPAAVESRGVKVFVQHRVRRLLRPLLFGAVFILPFSYLIAGYGLLANGLIDLENILSWRFPAIVRHHLYGFGHLWFLEYLFVVCVLWAGCWAAAGWVRRRLFPGGEARSAWPQWVVESPARPFLLALPTALIFLADPDTFLRIENIAVPNLARIVHYTVFFAAGAWLARVKEPKARLAPQGPIYLALAAVTFVAMWPLLFRHFGAPLSGNEARVLAVLAALFPWLMTFGSIGVLLRTIRAKGPVLRFLSEASFWLYIIHLPVVQLLQALLLPLGWPGPVKFLITSAVTLAVSLWSYEVVVRYSLVGELINGARKRAPRRGWLGHERGWVVSLTAMVAGVVVLVWSFRAHLWEDNFHETPASGIYRSARLEPAALDKALARRGIRTVVTFGGGDHHRWYQRQGEVCKTRGAVFVPVNLRGDIMPSRDTLRQLVEIHDHCPRPMLVQGYRGLDACAFATAVEGLLDGQPLDSALVQFSPRYGQYGGPDKSLLGITLLAYRDWLASQGLEHTPARFRSWAAHDYLVSSFPIVPETVQERVAAITTSDDRAAVRR